MPDIAVITMYVILFALITTFFLYRAIKKKGPQTRPGTFGSARTDLQIKEQLDNLLVEIQQISRDQIAKLDTKIRMLNQLILDADDRIEVLKSLQKNRIASPAPAPAKPSPPKQPERPSNPLHERIYKLRDKGKSVTDISNETGQDIGEIELILGLRDVR